MTRHTQRLDAGTRHVLAWCTGCPPWRELTGSTAAAHLVAADHAERVHGDTAAAKEHRRRARVIGNGGGSTTNG
jgi:hypothetical protein